MPRFDRGGAKNIKKRASKRVYRPLASDVCSNQLLSAEVRSGLRISINRLLILYTADGSENLGFGYSTDPPHLVSRSADSRTKSVQLFEDGIG